MKITKFTADFQSIETMENENAKTWTAEMWEESLPIYESILEQPFIRELADGSLSQERFSRYIAQDEIYLSNYGKQMEAFAELLDDADEKAMFKAFAEAGMESEKAMHQLLIDRCGIDCDVQPSPVTLAYGEHSRKAIESGVKEIALAALLPCMWIYNRVGLDILDTARKKNCLDGNPYKEWILEYGNEEYCAGVRGVLEMADRWAARADADTRKAMKTVYLEAARYEYDFWDYGYRG